MKRRYIPILLALASVALAGFAAVAVPNIGGGAPSLGMNALKGCLAMYESSGYSDETDQCVIDFLALSVVETIESKDTATLGKIMSALETSSLNDYCHQAGHEAMGEVYKRGYRMDQMVKYSTYSECGGGLLHGVFDYAATSEPTPEEWVSLGHACADIMINGSPDLECAIAFGHATLHTSPTLHEAFSKCMYLRPSGADELPQIRSGCALGAIMELYIPAIDPEKAPKMTDAAIVDACTDLPSDTDRAVLQGCWEGVGYNLAGKLEAYEDERGLDPKWLPLTTLTTQANEQVGRCSIAGDFEESCVSQYWNQYLSRMHRIDGDATPFCKSLKPEFVAMCLRGDALVVARRQ